MKTIDLLPKEEEFLHLCAGGEMTLNKDNSFNIPCLEINLRGFLQPFSDVGLWTEAQILKEALTFCLAWIVALTVHLSCF